MQHIFRDVLGDVFAGAFLLQCLSNLEVGRYAWLVCDLNRFLLQGAPETIQERLASVPGNYVETYKQYTRQGARVLALAYKFLPDMGVSSQLFSVDLDFYWRNYRIRTLCHASSANGSGKHFGALAQY